MVNDVGQNVILSEAKEPKHCHGPLRSAQGDKRATPYASARIGLACPISSVANAGRCCAAMSE